MLPAFFTNILGTNGFNVMQNLVKTSQDLESFLMPRIVMGWLRQSEYGNLTLPSNCPINSLSKSGYGYSGLANINDTLYSFSNSSEEHVTAIMAMATNTKIEPTVLRNIELARLSRTVDLLIKAEAKKPSHQFEQMTPASAIEPEQPKQPTLTQPAPNKTKSTTFKIPKLKTNKPLKITKSESNTPCPVCKQKLFTNNSFSGCVCFGPMSKNVKTTRHLGGFILDFGPSWDEEALLAIIGVFKNGQ